VSDVDVERSVLGAVLIDSRLYKQAAELRPDDFSLDSNRRIFARMIDLDGAGRPIDILTLQEELGGHGELDAIGGATYLASLIDGVPDRPSIQHYVRMVRTCADRRRAAKLVVKAQRLADDPSVPTTALAEIGNDLTELVASIESLPPRFSEEALALRFSRRYAEELRYVSRWGHWMRWDGMRWVEDDTLHVFDLARGICRGASAECSDSEKAIATRLASKATSAAVERLAAADRRHAATVSQWDSDPWLLNTPTGTLDLRTGKLHEHLRADLITKITAAGPGGDCPLWLQFLHRVTVGDSEFQSFLQRMCGYALTGCTREHALFFLYGTGANGKSVFLSTLSGLLADYAKTAPASSFTASTTEQHPTDLAGLRGARFVTAIETEDGAKWAEAKIKSLTGGDKIAARFMRCDFFEFTPAFKLVIAGNHKPGLRSVDEAIRRRLHLVPFTVTIPQDERDPRLGEKLRAEFPGIMAWAIQGCLAWQQDGLNPPAIVRKATANYLAAEDAIGRWLEDRCITDGASWTAGAALFSDYQTWGEQTGERGTSQKRLTQALEGRGFVQERTRLARGFAGIGLRSDVTQVTGCPVITVTRARGRSI
jgi:putative DNA primase/helicase